MPSARTRRLRNTLLSLTLLGLGLWMAGSALWQLGSRVLYVHESVVVTGTVIDVRQKPFESWAETLGKGNLSWPGDVSYQPIVRFTLPGGIDAIRLDLDADNEDYHTGQQVSIISPPTQPGKALLNRGKFLWGAASLRLGAGCLFALLGYALLRHLRGKRPAAAPEPARRKASQAKSAPARAPRTRKKAEGSSSRKRKKTESAATAPKPRRSRRKKAEEQQGELPL